MCAQVSIYSVHKFIKESNTIEKQNSPLFNTCETTSAVLCPVLESPRYWQIGMSPVKDYKCGCKAV